MSLKIRGLLAAGIGLVLGLSLSLGSAVLAELQPSAKEELPWEEARLLAEVLDRVKRDYVDAVDDERLIEAAIRGMVADLDPHSAYLDAEEYQEIRISTSGNYSGVGLEVSEEDGRVVVVAPIDGSPADRAGIRPGDVLISVDGMPVDTRDVDDTILRLRGAPGTEVRLGILRGDDPEPLSFELRRARISVASVKGELVEPGLAYIRLSHFSEATGRELREKIRELSRQDPDGLKGVVLDMRNNPGGVLEAAVEVADAFLDKGVIVSADGRVPEARFSMEAQPGDVLEGAPLTVLVNGGSASASEIVAGALQDHHRAQVVGSDTFGKGSVQTIMPLSYGRAIKLTTSRYYTPSGRSIHDSGIRPDFAAPEGEGATGVPPGDAQLSEALDILRNRRILHSRAD